MPTNLFTDDLNALDNDELYLAIAGFAKTQQSEGWRHDYTVQWSDLALTKVAAFSNTFGGILIVGVKKEKTDIACELVGVESETEYKTRIASAIAANISPVPSYDVFECHKPNFHNLRFCVVRVRERRSLHLITKKGLVPVYVRNEDQDLPADASQL
jgi:predicted HTH transcriptional regulator